MAVGKSAFSAFRPQNGANPEMDRLLDYLSQSPIFNGNLIENVQLTTSATNVPHMLGRAYRGWILVNQDTAETVYATSSALDGRFLTLTASAACTVSVWVF